MTITAVSHTHLAGGGTLLCLRVKGAPNRVFSATATHTTATSIEGHGRYHDDPFPGAIPPRTNAAGRATLRFRIKDRGRWVVTASHGVLDGSKVGPGPGRSSKTYIVPARPPKGAARGPFTCVT